MFVLTIDTTVAGTIRFLSDLEGIMSVCKLVQGL